MSLDERSRAAFGRRGPSAPPPTPAPMAAAPAAKPFRPSRLLALVAWELCLVALAVAATLSAGMQKAAIQAEGAHATQAVIDIVNQPVTHLPRTAAAAVFSPGWFHPGAIRPDFATVDVRQTQELVYDKDTYVTSDLNPSEMFLGGELEFNAMTKAFYVDRTLPKKRLSEAEMLRINELYRAIAHSDQMMTRWWTTVAGLAVLGLALAAAPLLVFREHSQTA